MISLILLLQAATAQPTPDIDAYKNCIQSSAAKLERARESAGDTVEAAVATCESMRVKFRSADLTKRPEGSVFTAKDYRDLTFQIWDKVTELERSKALIAIFQARLNNARNR